MDLLQNQPTKQPTFIKGTLYEKKIQERYLDLVDILYPQRREQNQSNIFRTQQSLSIQITRQTTLYSENNRIRQQNYNEISQLHGQLDHINHFVANQGGIQRAALRSRQSNKHNFPKHLVRKIKDLMKKILNIKKKAKLQGITCLRKLYFYFFHQNLRKHENIHILHLFMQDQDQIETLYIKFKEQMEKHGLQQDISLQLMNSLRSQLRKTILQHQENLLSLIENGQICRKQQFIDFVKQFLKDMKKGKVRSTQK